MIVRTGRLMLALCLLLSAASAEAYSSVYFFGDSFTDTGNNGPGDVSAALPGSYGYDPDRWTHAGGPVWSESFASALGFAPAAVASSDGGNNYAVGGARADQLASQIGGFDTDVSGSADPNALYVILAGGNDMLQGQDPSSTVTDVTNAILSLSALGATSFLVGNLPDFSPLAPGGGPLGGTVPIPPGADLWADAFNTALSSALAGLSGLTILEFDLAAVVDPLIADPVGNGFSAGLALCSEDASCIAGVGTENFLMQDHVHFMPQTHELISAGAIAAVPEPGTALQVALGLMLLGMRARRFGSDAAR